MDQYKSQIQHQLNPIHVYCWLRKIGIKRQLAIRIGKIYEKIIYIILRRIIK